MAIRSAAWFMLGLVYLGTFLLADGKDETGMLATSSKWGVKTDQMASIAIVNVMDAGSLVSAHCYSSQQDATPTIINTGIKYTITFTDNLTVNIPWTCDFSVVGGTSNKSFTAWTHDGTTPYLSICDECSWEVQDDGFYVQNSADTIFYKVYSWN